MMTMIGAKERTRAEYTALFKTADLALVSVSGPEGGLNVIEAHPASQ